MTVIMGNILSTSNKLAYSLGVAILLAIGSFAWWFLRRGKKGQAPDDGESNGTQANPTTIQDSTSKRTDRSSEAPKQLNQIAKRCDSSETREFMEDIIQRIQDEGPQFDISSPMDFIEEVVDRIDDLQLMQKKANSDDSLGIDEFIKKLTVLLRDSEVELIHSETWNPEIQRALVKNPTEGVSEPMITSFGSTGISRQSKVIRKQEVLLAIPPKTKT